MATSGVALGARKKKKKRRQAPRRTGDVGRGTSDVRRAAPQLAEGTRSDIKVQPTKGMCFATKCHTVDEFVSTFHRYCEDSSIFIPDARRAVGTSLAFSFELADKQSVLLGAGTVVEEFTTVDNRFGREGIVVSVKKLKPESIEVFKRMLAARTEAPVDQDVVPVRGRAMTAQIPIQDVRAVRHPTRPLEVHIPSPGERTTTKPRTNPVLGVPVIARSPAKQPVVQIPGISPRRETKHSPPIPIPEATPRRAFDTPDTMVEDVSDAIPEVEEDTVHDDVPFALRNEARLLEESRQVPKVVDVDSGWELDEPAMPAAELAAPRAPEASLHHVTAHEPDPAAHEPVALPPPPVDAVPVATAWVLSGAATTRDGTAMRDEVAQRDQRPTAFTSWDRPLRWAVRVAIVSTLFIAAVAIAAFVESSASTPAEPPRVAPEPPAAEPVVDREQLLPACEQPPTAVEQLLPAPERMTPGEPHPFLAGEQRLAPQQPPSDENQQLRGPGPQVTDPDRPRAATPRVAPKRPRPAVPKMLCSGLDCL